MFKNFFSNFKMLPESNKAMVYLMWIYSSGSLISSTFVSIYILKINNSFNDVIIFNLIFFTFTFIGFSFLGYLASIFQKDIKNMYYIAYIFFIFSFVELLLSNGNIYGAYIYSVIFALGNGLFRNAVHTQELKNISNQNRDFYSSTLSAGGNIITVIMPLFISSIFFVTELYKVNGYIFLFLLLPIIYLISFIFIKNIDSYIPKKIKKEDVKNFFNMKKYKYGHLYFFVGGIITSIYYAIMPIINISLLKSEINIGLFQGILTLISTFLVVHLSFKRNSENRFKYFAIIVFFIAINYVIFGIFFSLLFLIIYNLIQIFINPIFKVSEHVYDLSMMDNIKTGTSDFYPAMILRETFLWIGRIFGLLVLLLFLKIFLWKTEEILVIGLFMIGFSFLLLILSVYLWEKYEKTEK